MKIYLYTRNPNLNFIIASELERNGFNCLSFSSQEMLIETLQDNKYMPEIILADFTVYNHVFFSVYEFLIEKRIFLPILFFNDPCPYVSDYLAHWKITLQQIFLQGPTPENYETEDDFIEHFEGLLKILHTLFFQKGLAKYIPCFQKPEPLPDNFSYDKIMGLQTENPTPTDLIENFKIKSGIPNNFYFLLKYFSKNENRLITYSDISDYYNLCGKQLSKQSLSTLISNLRKSFASDKDCNFSILSTKEGYVFSTNIR